MKLTKHVGWWHILISRGVYYLCTPTQIIAIDYFDRMSEAQTEEIEAMVETMNQKSGKDQTK